MTPDTTISGPAASTQVTIEDYVCYNGTNLAQITAVAGDHVVIAGDGSVQIRGNCGTLFDLKHDWVVVRYGAGEHGTLAGGAFRRYYPHARLG